MKKLHKQQQGGQAQSTSNQSAPQEAIRTYAAAVFTGWWDCSAPADSGSISMDETLQMHVPAPFPVSFCFSSKHPPA